MISLIKGGAFDNMMDRKECMAWYIWETCDKKKRITLQNMNGLMKYGLLPEDSEDRIMARRIYEFNRYLKAITIPANKLKPYYVLDERATAFLIDIQKEDLICKNGNTFEENVFIEPGAIIGKNNHFSRNCTIYSNCSIGDNNYVTLECKAADTGSKYKYLKYNVSSPRFANYSTTPEKLVFYKKNSSSKQQAELSFDVPSYKVAPGTLLTSTVKNPNGLTVSYASDDEDIAYVDETTGEVLTGNKFGTATITASSAADDTVSIVTSLVPYEGLLLRRLSPLDVS